MKYRVLAIISMVKVQKFEATPINVVETKS
jgi:hypothetical protein